MSKICEISQPFNVMVISASLVFPISALTLYSNPSCTYMPTALLGSAQNPLEAVHFNNVQAYWLQVPSSPSPPILSTMIVASTWLPSCSGRPKPRHSSQLRDIMTPHATHARFVFDHPAVIKGRRRLGNATPVAEMDEWHNRWERMNWENREKIHISPLCQEAEWKPVLTSEGAERTTTVNTGILIEIQN